MVKILFSNAKSTYLKIDLDSFKNKVKSLYRVEKCPSINFFTLDFFAIKAACSAVE